MAAVRVVAFRLPDLDFQEFGDDAGIPQTWYDQVHVHQESYVPEQRTGWSASSTVVPG